MHDGLMFGMWWIWLLGLLLLVAVIWAVVRTASRGGAEGDAAPRERSPEEVLHDRLARGDIDEEEYRSRMQALRDDR